MKKPPEVYEISDDITPLTCIKIYGVVADKNMKKNLWNMKKLCELPRTIEWKNSKTNTLHTVQWKRV